VHAERLPAATAIAQPVNKGMSLNSWLWIAGGAVAIGVLATFLIKLPVPGPAGPSGARSQQTAASRDYDAIIQQALQLDQKHAYPDEIAVLDKAVRMDPNAWQAYNLKAQVYLYNFLRWPEAKENFQRSLAHGGDATFHVAHDHGGGDFTALCDGWLYVARDSVEYKSWKSAHRFRVSRKEITEVESAKSYGTDHHAVRVRVNNQLWTFAPLGQFLDEQRAMIVEILGGG